MSNFSQRLDKLEPPPQHSEYLKEVSQRLFRYGVETRHLVHTGKLEALAWGEEAETIYQQWKKDPSFDALERAVLANPSYYPVTAWHDEKTERPTNA